MTLRDHSVIGRTVEHGLRELVISRGRSAYLALYRVDLSRNLVRILATMHQREAAQP
jgi:plasmid stabilization system protein ParE